MSKELVYTPCQALLISETRINPYRIAKQDVKSAYHHLNIQPSKVSVNATKVLIPVFYPYLLLSASQ